MVGERVGDNEFYLEYITNQAKGVLMPAFYYRNNTNYITKCIDNYKLRNCMLICENDVNPDEPNFARLVKQDEISSINVEDPGRNRALNSFLKNLNKNYIRMNYPAAEQRGIRTLP